MPVASIENDPCLSTGPDKNAMIVAHQFTGEFATKLAARVGGTIDLVALGDDPWVMPQDAEVLLVNPFHPGRISRNSPRPAGWPAKLRWVHMRSTGIDSLPAWIFEVPLVTVSRGAQAVAIAEYTLAAMLAFEKKLPDIWLKSREQWRRAELGGLSEKVLGIIGFGHIGTETARRALAFDMRVMAVRRTAGPSGMEGVEASSLDEVLAGSDHILISAPLTEETRNLLDAGAFMKMKRGMHLVNVGRGAIIDTDALRNALDSGTVAMASLDVVQPEPPPEGHWVYDHPQVHLTAHLSSSAPATEAHVDRILFENIKAYSAGNIAGMHGIVVPGRGY
jgi:phosphoglycerate dehydrogenase-like enzyme